MTPIKGFLRKNYATHDASVPEVGVKVPRVHFQLLRGPGEIMRGERPRRGVTGGMSASDACQLGWLQEAGGAGRRSGETLRSDGRQIRRCHSPPDKRK